MAGNNHFLTQIYGLSYPLNNAIETLNGSMGVAHSFPSAGYRAYGLQTATVISGVTVNSVVESVPTGLNTKSLKFYSVDSVATINTAAT